MTEVVVALSRDGSLVRSVRMGMFLIPACVRSSAMV